MAALTNEYTSYSGHFDGHAEALKQYMWHCPMKLVQGYILTTYRPGCRQGDNQQNNNAKCTQFAGRFDGHRNPAVQYQAHRLMEEVQGFHKRH
jgi:hypothetical protein